MSLFEPQIRIVARRLRTRVFRETPHERSNRREASNNSASHAERRGQCLTLLVRRMKSAMFVCRSLSEGS